jgi:hypothetical protein
MLFTHLSISGHWSCFHHLGTVNNVVWTIGIQVSVQVLAANSPGYIFKSGIFGSHCNSVIL